MTFALSATRGKRWKRKERTAGSGRASHELKKLDWNPQQILGGSLDVDVDNKL
jgi:hypothetical protein